jgi:hypothetical protein
MLLGFGKSVNMHAALALNEERRQISRSTKSARESASTRDTAVLLLVLIESLRARCLCVEKDGMHPEKLLGLFIHSMVYMLIGVKKCLNKLAGIQRVPPRLARGSQRRKHHVHQPPAL